MKHLENILIESLGFSVKKTKVYLALLELGETEASAIAQKANLKRTTVYNILPELVADGLVSMTLRKGKKVFAIDSPSRLSELVEEKKLAVEKILPDLSSMQSLFFHKPKTTIHEGVQGFKEIYRDFITSSSKGDTILAYAGTRDHFKYLPEEFVREYTKKRINKNIKLRLISGSSKLSEELQSGDAKSLRETKVTDSKDFDFSGETIVYGNKVAFISYRENFLGVIIESKEISAMHRAAFNLLWEKLD
jgi:sugar-specific transcriptional regulator TrmB